MFFSSCSASYSLLSWRHMKLKGRVMTGQRECASRLYKALVGRPIVAVYNTTRATSALDIYGGLSLSPIFLSFFLFLSVLFLFFFIIIALFMGSFCDCPEWMGGLKDQRPPAAVWKWRRHCELHYPIRQGGHV